MKTFTGGFVIACWCVTLAGCSNSGSAAHRDETPGEQVGRAAYVAKQDAKKAAKEITQDLKSFRQDAKEGYQEEKAKRERDKAAEQRTAPPQ